MGKFVLSKAVIAAMVDDIITQKQVRSANSYVKKRRNYESAAQRKVYNLSLSAVKYLIHWFFDSRSYFDVKIMEAVRSGKSSVFAKNEKTKPLLDKLKSGIKDVVVTYAVGNRKSISRDATEEEKQEHDANVAECEAWADEWWNSEDIQTAVESYTDRLCREAEIIVLCGMKNNDSETEIIEQYKQGMETAFLTDYVLSGLEGDTLLAARWFEHRTTFKKNSMASAARGLAELSSFIVAKVWMQYLISEKNTYGFYVRRGSSYPCSMCDDAVGLHSADDTANLPPLHKHCCCIAIPLTQESYMGIKNFYDGL
jgi:hypothetical protein